MTRTGGTGRAGAAAVLAASLAWPAAEGAGVAMELPDGVEWTRISEQRQGGSYQREWVPSGSGPEDAVWLIVEQRLELAGPTTAAAALATIHGSSRNACTAVRFEGPEAIEGGGQGVAGRIYCAHQHGRPHGTVTDQRIAVDGMTMHVVTSELRTPAMEYATELVGRGGYSSLHFVGHSLGGGEAMAMAAATGRYGAYTVFNSAGLHPRTVGREAFGRLRGTHFQSSWDVLRLGNALTPASVPGVRVPLGWAGFHPMTGVCRRMECFLPR